MVDAGVLPPGSLKRIRFDVTPLGLLARNIIFLINYKSIDVAFFLVIELKQELER